MDRAGLARLLALNAERAAEKERAGLAAAKANPVRKSGARKATATGNLELDF